MITYGGRGAGRYGSFIPCAYCNAGMFSIGNVKQFCNMCFIIELSEL